MATVISTTEIMNRATSGGHLQHNILQPPLELIVALDLGKPDAALQVIKDFKESVAPTEMLRTYRAWQRWGQIPEYADIGNFLNEHEAEALDFQLDLVALREELAVDDTPPSLRSGPSQ